MTARKRPPAPASDPPAVLDGLSAGARATLEALIVRVRQVEAATEAQRRRYAVRARRRLRLVPPKR